MTRRLLLTYLTITAFVLVVVVVPLGLTFASREKERFVFDIERDAQAVASLSEDALEQGQPLDLDSVFTDYDVPGARILVVDADGQSVADSGRTDIGRDYSTRPEIDSALAGVRTTGSRFSSTLQTNLVYVAVPVASNGVVHGAVRITVPSTTVDERVRETWVRLGALSVVVLATVGAVGLILARSVTRPVRRLEEAARSIADGDLDARAGDVGGAPELASLARQFDATAERLQQLVDVQKRFVADASHQLRTPLTALRLRLETLTPGPDDAAKVEAALAEVDRLSRLVQSLLVLARSDEAQPVIANVDLAAAATGRIASWGVVATRQEVELRLSTPPELLVRAVEGGPEQMLDNVVANALAVAPAGSVIDVAAESLDDGGALLTVTDGGPGLTEDQRAQATARFWRPPDAPAGGSGLGLAIVDHLALAGGGQLTLAEAPDGSGLQVQLQFAPPAPGPTAGA